MKSKILIVLMLVSGLFAETNYEETPTNEVDCLILEDENSIICKYMHERVNFDKNVTFDWIDPKGEVSRSRVMTIPAGHGSVYDFRYIKGRIKGEWTFKVVDENITTTTTFILE